MFAYLDRHHTPDTVDDAVHVARVALHRGHSAEEALQRACQHYVRQTGGLPPYLIGHIAASCRRRRPTRIWWKGSVPSCPGATEGRFGRRDRA